MVERFHDPSPSAGGATYADMFATDIIRMGWTYSGTLEVVDGNMPWIVDASKEPFERMVVQGEDRTESVGKLLKAVLKRESHAGLGRN